MAFGGPRSNSNRQIAANLSLTVGTVENYVHRLFEKLDVHSRAELIALVERIRRGEG